MISFDLTEGLFSDFIQIVLFIICCVSVSESSLQHLWNTDGLDSVRMSTT